MRRALLVGALVLVALPSRAETQVRYSVAAFGGYATEARNFALGGTSAYRLGFGVRAGVSLPKLYVGAFVAHHFGTHDVVRSPGLVYDARYDTTMFGPEVGYDAAVSTHIVLRPYLGGGLLYARSRTLLNDSESNQSQLRAHFTLGLVATYRFDRAFVGVDLRGVFAPLADPTRWAPGAFVTAGYSF